MRRFLGSCCLLAADWVAQGRLLVFVETVSQVRVVPRVTMAGDLRSMVALVVLPATGPWQIGWLRPGG